MIFLRVSSRSEEKIERIATMLLAEKLVMDVNIKRSAERATLEDGKLVRTSICLLTAKTKGLLFRAIDKRIQDEFGDNMPEVYSLPIVDMDWEQAKELTQLIQPA